MNDGGPAYPSEQTMNPDGMWNQTGNPGMSVRQRYKMAVMAAMSPKGWDDIMTSRNFDEGKRALAHNCGALADALITEDEAHNAMEAHAAMLNEREEAKAQEQPETQE